MSCPDAEALLAYAEGRADAATTRRVAEHVPACPGCAEVLERAEGHGPSPGDRVGRYRLLAALGRGAMGSVFEAEDLALGRRVALKVLASGTSERLLQETRALARVRHRAVVAVHDVGRTERGEAYFAMELVPGCSVRDLIAIKPPSRSRVLALFIEAGRGLAAAHDAGIAHGDVKPANLLVTPSGEVKVVDFGLAGSDGDGSVGLGTPAYAAPERHAGGPATPKSDQYSFCVALREALGPVRSRRIGRALERGTAGDPAARYATMVDLLADLRPPGPRAPLALGLVGLALVGVVAAWPNHPCTQVEARAARVWGAAHRDEVDATLHEPLDAFAVAWAEDARSVCEAQLQAHAVPAHQQVCVDEGLADLRAVVDVASDPPAQWRSDVALRWLGQAGDCARPRPRSLRPPDPAKRRAALERSLSAAALAPASVWMLVDDPQGGTQLQLRRTPDLALRRRCAVDYDVELWELALREGQLYTIDRERDRVLRIDPSTCAIERVATLPRPIEKNGRGFDIGPDGTALAILEARTLHRLAPSLTASASKTSMQRLDVESLALCRDGTAYLAGQWGHRVGRDLYRLEPGGEPARIGPIGDSKIDIDVLTCTAQGHLLGADTLGPTEGRLQWIDPNTGQRTELGVVEGGILGLAASGESTVTNLGAQSLQVG